MKKVLTLLSAALLTVACQESLEDRCAREARDFTQKHCPTVVSKDIVMDSMTFDKATHTIGYCYTLHGVMDDTLALNKGQARELLLKELRNAASLKLYKEAGYNFRYTYHSGKEKGTKLFEATFHQKDYR